LIALMVFSFARIGAALAMKVEDVFVRNRRLWVRLREKGGKAHAMPCHHRLEECLTAYLEQAGIMEDGKRPLFRTIGYRTARLTRTPSPQANAYAMISRRTRHHGRYRDQAGQPQLPGDGDHGLPEEQRHAGESRRHGEPCQHPHDLTLRSPARRDEPQ